ncbi:bifunctional glycosyltransferase family 2/GtrA family protein [Streptomyces sp. NBC_00201]|uniref:bifunctional glycosyltransferase family 2/GtrA family protein n=1 Tax=unclassified Streptomyces TaxID=2593676 RepID=UPI0022541682|nr:MULTISPECIES: bifunctional glycosyltransferase family 2/GtrA family protein [unclassified Streptomyces]MCX5247268.1 bifunctional glycosyltransferase family 2/GtrA family protein [Streptomyces sp. NBC_00201]MCX5286970.1 bifunctional glycosyltransferase family 2/GtrA family protein [Streptomyces sp. NBC_00183]
MRTDSSPGTLPAREHLPAGDAGTPVLDVVIPVYNEEKDLQPCVLRLHDHLKRTFPYAFRITIADNASTDTTPLVAARLEEEIPEVSHFRLEQKGRGRALRTVWSASEAPILAYMDVDLSTDLNALLPLVAPLISGHSDLAIGSRLARSSRVVRGPKREFISRAYNLILRGSLQARFSDAQCGFKAIRRDVAQVLLPMVEDTGWFFDTEMLVIAERAGLRIHEVPVDWVDDPDSTVHIVKTATEDLKGVWRVGKALATGSLPLDRITRPFGDDPRDREIQDVPKGLARQLVGFCVVGGLSTLFYLVLYSLFRQFGGSQVANALALLVSAVANTAANRRLTFGVRGSGGAVRHQAQGLVVFGIGLALTSGSLAALNAATSDPGHSTELAVLIAANLAATVLRFLLFRAWVFPDRNDGGQSTVVASHNPSSPTYAMAANPQHQQYSQNQQFPQQTYGSQPLPLQPPLPQPPLPQRPATQPTGQQGYQTNPFRAGEVADRSWEDATVHLQPVRPTDNDPRDSR